MGNVLVFLKFGSAMILLTVGMEASRFSQLMSEKSLLDAGTFFSMVAPASGIFVAAGLFGLFCRTVVRTMMPGMIDAKRRDGTHLDINEFALRHIFELNGAARPIKRQTFWSRSSTK